MFRSNTKLGNDERTRGESTPMHDNLPGAKLQARYLPLTFYTPSAASQIRE